MRQYGKNKGCRGGGAREEPEGKELCLCRFLTSVYFPSFFGQRLNCNESVGQEGGLTQRLSHRVQRSALISIKCHLLRGPAVFGPLIPAHLFLRMQPSGVGGRGPISLRDLGGGARSLARSVQHPLNLNRCRGRKYNMCFKLV